MQHAAAAPRLYNTIKLHQYAVSVKDKVTYIILIPSLTLPFEVFFLQSYVQLKYYVKSISMATANNNNNKNCTL